MTSRLDKNQITKLLDLIESCIISLTLISSNISQLLPVQKQLENIYSDEKQIPLLFGNTNQRVGSYSSSIRGDKRVIRFTSNTPINWDSRPISWLSEQIKTSSYHIDNNFIDCLVVEVPIDDKFGKLLGQVAWAFDVMNNPREERK